MPCGKWFKLDRDFTLLEVGPDCSEILRQCLGKNIPDCFPESFELYRSLYEEAFEEGSAGGVLFDPSFGTINQMNVRRDTPDTILCAFAQLPLVGLMKAVQQADQWLRELADDEEHPPVANGSRRARHVSRCLTVLPMLP